MKNSNENEQHLIYLAHNHIFSKAASSKLISLSMPIHSDYSQLNKSESKDN